MAEPESRTAPAVDDDDDDDDTTADEEALTQRHIEELRRERDSIRLGGPITLLSVGGGIGLMSLTLAANGGSLYAGESSRPPSQSPSGWYLVSGIGFAAALGGLLWLIDCNQRRGDIEDRIERLRHRSEFAVLPAVDPKTGTAALTWTGRF